MAAHLALHRPAPLIHGALGHTSAMYALQYAEPATAAVRVRVR
ncbi:hypothetical protein [Streptomyces sp. HD]|nr:hypothetical protein [Streptomyces sp. HD]MDC0765990.1 hypothetical protein [Streptomyces sp. HD]